MRDYLPRFSCASRSRKEKQQPFFLYVATQLAALSIARPEEMAPTCMPNASTIRSVRRYAPCSVRRTSLMGEISLTEVESLGLLDNTMNRIQIRTTIVWRGSCVRGGSAIRGPYPVAKGTLLKAASECRRLVSLPGVIGRPRVRCQAVVRCIVTTNRGLCRPVRYPPIPLDGKSIRPVIESAKQRGVPRYSFTGDLGNGKKCPMGGTGKVLETARKILVLHVNPGSLWEPGHVILANLSRTMFGNPKNWHETP